MQVGQLSEAHVEDVTLWLDFTWGQLKTMKKAVQRMDEGDLDALTAVVEEHILPAVRKVEGLQAKDGTPVAVLTTEILDSLPPAFLGELIEAVVQVGSRVGGGASPPA